MKTRKFFHYLVAAATLLLLSNVTFAQASITGPIPGEKPGHPSKNFIYNSSAIPLAEKGYTEQEYFIEGKANRYSTPELATGEIVDSDHPYQTRFFVRRPPESNFNGTVVIEWLNVTGGTDKDIDWWQSGHHFVRNGYAYIGLSAQRVGIASLKEWSPERYGKLDVTVDGKINNDALSYDILTAVAQAVLKEGQTAPAGAVDILNGLRAKKLVATGHSQSASRLSVYFNNVHPRNPIFDGAIIHGGGGIFRDDQDVKIFKLMAETDMARRAATPQPDSQYFRQWEVAGSSHVDELFEIEYSRERALAAGESVANAGVRSPDCDLTPYSHVPFRDVMNAAFEHMQVWIEKGTPPPTALPLAVNRAIPRVEFARDDYGNILGGIQLAAHAVPTAKNTGMNTGSNRFCRLYGSHEPFDQSTLKKLYPSKQSYVDAVTAIANQNVADGYILPYAAENTINAAKLFNW